MQKLQKKPESIPLQKKPKASKKTNETLQKKPKTLQKKPMKRFNKNQKLQKTWNASKKTVERFKQNQFGFLKFPKQLVCKGPI